MAKSSGSTLSDEFKEYNTRRSFSKFEYDLYHEEYDTKQKVIRVKRSSLPNNGERWKIFEDNKIVFTIEGSDLNDEEKKFLRSPDGVIFLINMYKNKINFDTLKNELNKKLTP